MNQLTDEGFVLRRQKTILAILAEAGVPLTATSLVKLAFLLRQETEYADDAAFYDFVPYKYGPFSFSLYREIDALKHDGYILESSKDHLALSNELRNSIRQLIDELSTSSKKSVKQIVLQYAALNRNSLLRIVYESHPWYATRSELHELKPRSLPSAPKAIPAVYTMGYQQKSVDSFFNRLLNNGIAAIADVRANPISRKYGFARRSMESISNRLGIRYTHYPSLGIASAHRSNLSTRASYEKLFDLYQREILPNQSVEIVSLADSVSKVPTVLVCMEQDAEYCHRSRLADGISLKNRLPIRHL